MSALLLAKAPEPATYGFGEFPSWYVDRMAWEVALQLHDARARRVDGLRNVGTPKVVYGNSGAAGRPFGGDRGVRKPA